jgi:uncharacterized protein (TIGR03067 family)
MLLALNENNKVGEFHAKLFGGGMFAFPTGACLADDDAVKSELKKFEGTWQLESATNNGKHTPEEVVKMIRVVIKESKHSVYFGDKPAVKEIPFTLDPTKNPKTSTDKLPDGREIKGIYKLDGDTLTSCVAEPDKDRPTEFSSKEGSNWTLRVFKRVKE